MHNPAGSPTPARLASRW